VAPLQIAAGVKPLLNAGITLIVTEYGLVVTAQPVAEIVSVN
jgi:hypothetical protein